MNLPYRADAEVKQAIAALGRTEDIMFSPSNRRLAVAGFAQHVVLIADLDIDLERDPNPIVFSSCVTLSSQEFHLPHGLSWLDERTLVVGNRGGGISITAVPEPGQGARRVQADIKLQLPADDDLINSPGSVCCLAGENGQAEILVCNNYIDNVARHLIDVEGGFASVSAEKLLAKGLSVPDSICASHDRNWIAVSVHNHHAAFVYRTGPTLGPEQQPDGKLLGISYPHGLRFSSDGKFCLVADAGAPCVHIYAAEDGNWAGEREPVVRLRILDDATYFRGAINKEEGGPKGIDLTADSRLMVTTCEEQQIVFTDLREGLSSLCEAGRKGEPRPNLVTDTILQDLTKEWLARAAAEEASLPLAEKLWRRAKRVIKWGLVLVGLRRKSS